MSIWSWFEDYMRSGDSYVSGGACDKARVDLPSPFESPGYTSVRIEFRDLDVDRAPPTEYMPARKPMTKANVVMVFSNQEGDLGTKDLGRIAVGPGDTLNIDFEIPDLTFEAASAIYHERLNKALLSPGGRL